MLVSSINFHQGAVALNHIGDFVCSTHCQTFPINEDKIVPEYLIKVLRSATFIDMVAGLKANGIKNTCYSINDLQKESLFGLSVKASLDKKKDIIPVLRMSNVINGEIDCSKLKYLVYDADCERANSSDVQTGGGQYNLNSDEIGAIRIPVPSIPEQKNIIEKYYSTKDGANSYYKKAPLLREMAAADFEKAIFS